VLPIAEHLQQAKAPRVQYLARTLTDLGREIAEGERQIRSDFEGLPEANWIRSLPGVGDNLAPALLACLGRDIERFATPAQAQAFMGTAPVTKASGRYRKVSFRHGCWKFARRTLQLFADLSRHASQWAQNFYQKQRATGHSHHQALRALAHKWIKVLLALSRTGKPYSERVYSNSQQAYLLKQTQPRKKLA